MHVDLVSQSLAKKKVLSYWPQGYADLDFANIWFKSTS